MTERRRPLIGSQVLMELEMYPNGDIGFVDPVHVVSILPHREDGLKVEGVTEIRMYSHGGSILVLGNPDETALLIQQARQMISEVGIETLVTVIREEIEESNRKKSQLN